MMDAILNNFNTQDISECREKIASEDYVDILARYRDIDRLINVYRGLCYQIIGEGWVALYSPIQGNPPLDFGNYGYYSIPKLYGLMDQSSMIESGIIRIRNQSALNLLGRDVIIGFVDTGIDYLHKAFRNASGNTRILSIWDQTDNTGTLPEGINYGSVYDAEMINKAIASDNPYDIVPEQDEPGGHGTFIAGIAAGSIDGNEFTGAAPEASIIMVKLRPAKRALRDFYFINENALAYSESDIMMGVKYLLEQAQRKGKSLVICLGIGTSYGPHTAGTPLSQMISQVSDMASTAVVTPTGNEGNARHHFLGNITEGNRYETVEIRVGENERGFLLELWGQQPDIFSVEIITPSGEFVSRIQAGNRVSRKIEFIYEQTIIYLDYNLIETINGSQVITMRFDKPSQGIWKIRVFVDNALSGYYNMWLPISEFLTSDTYFMNSSPYVTLTQPSSAYYPITVSAYNHRDNSIWIDSGRGNAANGIVKPDIAAPGVSVYGPRAGSDHTMYTVKSGTSIAAAHTAGAAALLFEWKIRNADYSITNTLDIKSLLILGAHRDRNRVYPNPEWGYYGNIVLSS